MNTKWRIEFKGQVREVVTTDRDGHTAHRAWQKGAVFFKGEPSFPQCRVTRVVEQVTTSREDTAEKGRRAFEALQQPGELDGSEETPLRSMNGCYGPGCD